MWRQTGVSFRARSSDGRSFTVTETIQTLDAGSYDDPRATVEGQKRLTTTEGHHVNRISDVEFEVLGAGPLADVLRVRRL